MVRSIIRLRRKTTEEITNAVSDESLKFNSADFDVLEVTVDILEPLAKIRATCQSEMTATISMIVPSIVRIIDHLQQMDHSVSLLKKLIIQLDHSVRARFAGIAKRLFLEPVVDSDSFNDPLYFVATLLDPKFKFCWMYLMNYGQSFESQLKHTMINMVLDECERYASKDIDRSCTTESVTNTSTAQTGCSSNIRKRKLFQYDDNRGNTLFGSQMKVTDALTRYINESNAMSSLASWKTSPFLPLTDLVKRVFSVQASSAPIERAFSQYGLIMSPRRTSMRDELFQSSVFMRVNYKLS